MITTITNKDGYVTGFCEWRLVGPSGYDCENGEYVWVNDCWVHPSIRWNHSISYFVDEIMRTVPQAEYCYFQRKDVSNKLHMYSRRQWERRRHAYESQIIKEN